MKTPKFVKILSFVFALCVTLVIADQISGGMQHSAQSAEVA